MGEAALYEFLYELRIRGPVSRDRVNDRASREPTTLSELIDQGLNRALLIERKLFEPTLAVTASGREVAERWARSALEDQATLEVVESSFHAFSPLNEEFLSWCTRWQLRPEEGNPLRVNDHSDPHYDDERLEELGALHRQILPVLHQLSGAVDRYRQYPVRLDQALRRVREGERDWVARPVIDSYHTVWFELHEDLLAVLGRHRGKLDNSPNSILAPREPR